MKKKGSKKILEDNDKEIYDEADAIDEDDLEYQHSNLDVDDEYQKGAFDIENETSDDESDMASDLDNITEKEEYKLDERYLGKKKEDFYGTDFTDQRIHKVTKNYHKTKAIEALEVEEAGVRKFQERMAKESAGLSLSDLLPDINEEEESRKEKNVIKKKHKKEAKKQKTEKMKVSSDIKEIKSTLEKIIPIIKCIKDKSLTIDSRLKEYVVTKYFLCLNFLTNLSAYFVIEESGADMATHPVNSRLEQYRFLVKELGTCDRAFGKELQGLLDDIAAGKTAKTPKLLKILKPEKKKTKKTKSKNKVDVNNKKMDKMEIEKSNSDTDCDASNEMEETRLKGASNTEQEIDEQSDGHRLITSQIAKNKGLLPSRKKDQRNPRVRYRNKYKDKLKRRKGQVRPVRKETNRYDGEISGINAKVVKSVKFKY